MQMPLNTVLPAQKTRLAQPQISHLIRQLRQGMGLTQEQFAMVLGVTYTTINRWENAHMQPSPLALKQIRLMLKELSTTADPEYRQQWQLMLEDSFPEAT